MSDTTPMKITTAQDFKNGCRETGYQFKNAHFTSARLLCAMLCGDIDHPDLVLMNAQFSETDLRLAQCLRWKSTGVHFTKSSLMGAQFYKCDFVDVRFKGVTYFDPALSLGPAKFIESQLLYANFEGEALGSVVFSQCALKSAVFKDCDLRHARFLRCDLRGANFEHAVMEGVNLHGSQLDPGQLKDAEADDWSTVGLLETGMTIEQLRGVD